MQLVKGSRKNNILAGITVAIYSVRVYNNLTNDIIITWGSPIDSKVLIATEIKEADSKDVGSTGVFEGEVDGKNLTFGYSGGKFIDKETNSIWDITGKAVMGLLKGKQLRIINSGDYFAFAWFAFNPDTEVYKE